MAKISFSDKILIENLRIEKKMELSSR